MTAEARQNQNQQNRHQLKVASRLNLLKDLKVKLTEAYGYNLP
jgi:hypothetical protein